MSTRPRERYAPRTRRAVALVADQLGCDDDEALRRFLDRAESLQYRPYDYALLVIEGIVQFGD